MTPERSSTRALVDELDAALRAAGTPARAAAEQRYLKSALTHYGVTVPAIRRIARAAAKAHDLDRGALLAVVEALWAAPVHERRMAAVELLDARAALLRPGDLALLERLLREARTWAIVDGLAVNVVGALVARHPSLGRALDRWAKDPDFWLRRAAMLALLRPLRDGGGDFARFTRYADAMLDEPEFFIRKAIGWVLRDASRRAPDRVAAWLLPRAARCSSVTYREAIKHLSATDRARIEAARRPAASPAPRGSRAARPRARTTPAR